MCYTLDQQSFSFSENETYQNTFTCIDRHPAYITNKIYECQKERKSARDNQPHNHIKCKNNINIAHINISSLLPKMSEIRQIILNLNLDILAVQESRLDISIFDKEVMIDDYLLFRKDRNRHGGGIAYILHLVLFLNYVLNYKHQILIVFGLQLRSNPEKFLLDQYIDHHPLL